MPFGAIAFIFSHGNEINRAILADEGFVALCAALSSFLLYKVCRMYAAAIPSLISSLTLSFGTIVWPFATVLFNHDVAMLFSLFGVFCVLRLTKEKTTANAKLVLITAAGTSLALASTLEYLSVLLVIPLVLFLASKRTVNVLQGVLFVGVSALGPMVDLAYNKLVTGNPLVFPEDLCACANGQTVISRFDLSQLFTVPIYNLLSPYRGLLLISPVLIFGVYGLFEMYQSRRFRSDAILFLSIFILGRLPYSAWSEWQGGGSFGPRFLIDVIPYLVIPIAFTLTFNWSKRIGIRATFMSLFIVSSLINGAAAFTSADPISPTPANLLFFQAGGQSIPWLLQNNVDVWWSGYLPGLGVIIAVLCLVAVSVMTSALLSGKLIDSQG